MNLCLGDTGLLVGKLHERLLAVGCIAAAATPGVFDDVTFAQVRHFQARAGLPANGQVTKETWDALERAAEGDEVPHS